MSDLKSVLATLLSIGHPDRILRYVDAEMQLRAEHFDVWELKAKDHWLLPLFIAYAEDLDSWVKFAKLVRDRLAPDRGEPASSDYLGMRDFHKKVNVRRIQRRTRALQDTATSIAVKTGVLPDTWTDKQRYMKRCVQFWKRRKDAMQESVRQASPNKRISVDHREELLDAFWQQMEDEITNGVIPPP